MLKKMVAMVASKVMAIKVRIRAIETHLMIQSLLLRDKKMVRHLFQRRKCFQHSDEDLLRDDDDSESVIRSSVATTPASVVMQAAEEIDDTMEVEDDYVYSDSDNLPFEDNPEPEEEIHPVSDYSPFEHYPEPEEEVHPVSDYSTFKDYPDEEEVHPVSVIEMAKNSNEGRGKEFKLEDDIDKVADLFIQRFHHQIWLQKQQSEEGIHA